MKFFPWFWAPLVAALMLTAGCGSDSDGSATISPTQSPSPSATPSPSGPTAVPGPGVTNALILLGMTNDVSGAGMTPYAAISEAAQAYFQKVNEEDEGACGREIVLQVEDDSYAPHLALEKTKKLVEQNQVLAMIGGLGSEAQRGVAGYLQDPNADGSNSDGVPDLFVGVGDALLGDESIYPWTTTLLPDNKTDAAVLAAYIQDNLAQQAGALIFEGAGLPNQQYSEVMGQVLGPGFGQQAYDPPNTDVSAQVTAVQQGGAQYVVLATAPDVAYNAIAAANEVGYNPRWLLANAIAPSTLATQLGGGTTAEALVAGFRELDGAITTAFLLSAIENENDPAVIEHARIMETYDGPQVSSLSLYGQTLAEATVETLNRACSNLTRVGVLRAAESLVGYSTSLMLPGIEVNYSDTEHRGIQALQPMEIKASGEIMPAGDVIDTEPEPTPTPVPTLTPNPTKPTATPASTIAAASP